MVVGMRNPQMTVQIPAEVLFALQKEKGKRPFTVHGIRCNTLPAAMNKRSPSKAYVSAWVPRPLKRKLEKLAKTRKESLTDLVVWLLNKATENVELTSRDYAEITEEVRRAERGTGERVRRPGTQDEGRQAG